MFDEAPTARSHRHFEGGPWYPDDVLISVDNPAISWKDTNERWSYSHHQSPKSPVSQRIWTPRWYPHGRQFCELLLLDSGLVTFAQLHPHRRRQFLGGGTVIHLHTATDGRWADPVILASVMYLDRFVRSHGKWGLGQQGILPPTNQSATLSPALLP